MKRITLLFSFKHLQTRIIMVSTLLATDMKLDVNPLLLRFGSLVFSARTLSSWDAAFVSSHEASHSPRHCRPTKRTRK